GRHEGGSDAGSDGKNLRPELRVDDFHGVADDAGSDRGGGGRTPRARAGGSRGTREGPRTAIANQSALFLQHADYNLRTRRFGWPRGERAGRPTCAALSLHTRVFAMRNGNAGSRAGIRQELPVDRTSPLPPPAAF